MPTLVSIFRNEHRRSFYTTRKEFIYSIGGVSPDPMAFLGSIPRAYGMPPEPRIGIMLGRRALCISPWEGREKSMPAGVLSGTTLCVSGSGGVGVVGG